MKLEEILKKLKATYSNKGLPDKVLEVQAKRIAETANEQEEVEQAIKDLDDQFSIYQSLFDSNRTLVSENKKLIEKLSKVEGEGSDGNTSKQKGEGSEGNTSNSKDEGVGQLMKMMKDMSEQIDVLKTEKKQKTQKEQLVNQLNELGVSKDYYTPFLDRDFEDSEQIQEYANTIKEQEDKFLQSINYDKLKDGAEPEVGGFTKTGKKISSNMKTYLETKNKKK